MNERRPEIERRRTRRVIEALAKGARLFEFHAYGHSEVWVEFPERRRPPCIIAWKTLHALQCADTVMYGGQVMHDDGCSWTTEFLYAGRAVPSAEVAP